LNTALALFISFVFVALAVWHFRMAASAARGLGDGAVPSVEGKPLFVPSARATVAVGLVLLFFAALVAATAGFVQVGISPPHLSWACLALALGLLARAAKDLLRAPSVC
jgi:high-affinity Fe2+/Pb2+ permease